jgi:hypothetical protein
MHKKIAKELDWKVKINWTYLLAKKDAAQYDSYLEWTKKSNSYIWAFRNKMHKKIAKELGWKVRKKTNWDYITAKKDAANYTSLSMWDSSSSGSYQWASINKMQRKYSKERCGKV